MAGITVYGDFWGQIPVTAGRIFWVAPGDTYTVAGLAYNSGDGNDGLDPRRACRTINHVMDNLVLADAGDVVMLLPGTHSPQNSSGTATTITWDTAGVSMMGLPAGRPSYFRHNATISQVASAACMTISGNHAQLSNVSLEPATGQAAIVIAASTLSPDIHHCDFELSSQASHSSTRGIIDSGIGRYGTFEHLNFRFGASMGPGFDFSSMIESRIAHCTFRAISSTLTDAIEMAGADRMEIVDCQFRTGVDVTMTNGIDGTGTSSDGSVAIYNCVFDAGVTNPINNFAAADANLSNNYHMGIGSGDGGTLIKNIT